MENILVIGANGQLGSELVTRLQEIYNEGRVVSADIRPPDRIISSDTLFEELDVLNEKALNDIIKKHNIHQIYHLAAILSATGEKFPKKAWDLNINGLLNVLNVSVENYVKKVFWPSSIAVFGPQTPKENTPQHTIMDPATIYGISKLAGERWCQYFYNKYQLDVRSLRYPGLISYKTMPGGGTTDYAVDIFHHALQHGKYTCFLKENTCLPMMYMPDAIEATIQLMEAPNESIGIRSSYNIAALSFSPKELSEAIKVSMPKFAIDYDPDFRQQIAESWPESIDDSFARNEWKWQHNYSLERMTSDMIQKLSAKNNFAIEK